MPCSKAEEPPSLFDELDGVRRQLTRESFRLLNKVVTPLVEVGLGAPPPVAGTGIVLLETTGRSSGKPRRVPLVGFRLGDRAFVSTVRSDSQWVRNLESHPEATMWLDGKPRTVQSTVRSGSLTIVELESIPED
ncbi:MAG: nitroreductase/quinone reductase family protein [Acidimicrobiales bacterium]